MARGSVFKGGVKCRLSLSSVLKCRRVLQEALEGVKVRRRAVLVSRCRRSYKLAGNVRADQKAKTLKGSFAARKYIKKKLSKVHDATIRKC